MDTVQIDCLIFGGGVTGLWLLNRLRQAGYSALLFSDGPLGGLQTLNSAGMLHGGLRAPLPGSGADEGIEAMPLCWQRCLDGHGELDLSAVRRLADAQHLWAEPTRAAQTTLFLASRLAQGPVARLAPGDRPSPLTSPTLTSAVYRLGHPVLDTRSLVDVLATPYRNCIHQTPPGSVHIETDARQHSKAVFVHQGHIRLRIRPRRVFLAAGAGNAGLLATIGVVAPLMHRQPVHMVCIQHEQLPVFFGHCLGPQRWPRLTLSTHGCHGQPMWYVGGAEALAGASRDGQRQIAAVQELLKHHLPWQSLAGARFRAIRIDRVGPLQRRFANRDRAHVQFLGNHGLIWPTRLILAPNAAHQVLNHLQQQREMPHHPQPAPLPLSVPPLGSPLWENLFA